MELKVESGKSKLLFVGEGLDYDGLSGRPFSSDAATTVLRTGVLNAGLLPHFIELRKSSYEDVITPEAVDAVYKYISDNAITRVVVLGKSSITALFPSITHRQTMANLVASPMIQPSEMPTIQVGVMYHPVQVIKSNTEDAVTDWWGRLEELLAKKLEINVTTTEITSEEELFQLFDYLTQSDTIQSIDYETNAVDPFNKKHYVTCIGVAEKVSSDTANAWWFITERTLSPALCKRLGEYVEHNKKKVWAYNCTMEMKVTWHHTGKFIEMQDAMVLVTMFAERGSLKNVVRKNFGAMMWEAPVHEFKDKAESLFGVAKTKESVREGCLTGNFDLIRTHKGAGEVLDWMLDSYSEEEIKESLTHYPYEWGSIPKTLLGQYCARDAGYTTFIVDKFNTPEVQMAYEVYIRHPWLATKFEVNGVRWLDDRATELESESYEKMLTLLNNCIQESKLSPEYKLECNTIFHKELPYTGIWYTEKTKQERKYEVVTHGDKVDELKAYFNPSGNGSDNRALFWDAYLNDTIQLGSVLLLFIEDIELSGELPNLHAALGDKSFLYSNTPENVITKILELSEVKNPLGKQIQRSLAKSTDKLPEVIGRFAADVIKFQYQVHRQFFGLKIEDESTWSREFHMLFNIFYYKKMGKMVSTSINGSTGRGAVYTVAGDLHGKPLRDTWYWDPAVDKTMPMVLNTDFNTLAAATTRWSSGFHTIPAGSPARRAIGTKGPRYLVVHADYSQAELVVLSFLSQDPGMIQSFLDGKDMHKFVASKVFLIDYDKVTSEQRRFAKTVGFGIIYGKSIENIAIEITGGNVERAQALFDSFFNTFPNIKVWMQEKRVQVDEYGYVTTLLGNRLAVDTTQPGNAKYRVAINAPIQGLASTIAGTSMYEFSKAADEAGFETYPFGFTHDAYDDVTLVDQIIEYLDLLVFKLQDEVYQKTGIPMRIDFEIGVDSFNACGYSVVDRLDNGILVEIDGTDEALNKLLDTFRLATTFSVINVEEKKTKTESFSYEELFTVGKALKSNWGATITTKTLQVELQYNR